MAKKSTYEVIFGIRISTTPELDQKLIRRIGPPPPGEGPYDIVTSKERKALNKKSR